jgi:hypothetical protein
VGDRVKTTRRDGIDGLILRGKKQKPPGGGFTGSLKAMAEEVSRFYPSNELYHYP